MDIGTPHEWVDLAANKASDCIAIFHMEAVEQKAETRAKGRPIFSDVPFVKILIPGDRTSVVDREVRDVDKDRWPEQWGKFERNQEEVLSGTPVEEWPYLNRSQVATLKALNILTVEALRDLSDTGLQKIGPGARELQARAEAYLKPQSDVETELRQEIEELKAANAAITARLDEATRTSTEHPATGKKRGRPPKAA